MLSTVIMNPYLHVQYCFLYYLDCFVLLLFNLNSEDDELNYVIMADFFRMTHNKS